MLDWVVPIAVVGLVYLGVKAIGKDPGGQGGKLISAGTKSVATFL